MESDTLLTLSTDLNPGTTARQPGDDAPPFNISDVSDGCRVLAYLPWMNADNVISYDSTLLVYRALGGALTPLVALCGMPLNFLNCAVFFRQGLGQRINLLLFLLACSDGVVSAFLFVSTLEYLTSQLVGNFRINGPLVTFMTNYGSVLYGFVYVSAFISTVIAFERCLCITYPFLAKRILKTKTMAVIVAVSSVFLIAFIYFVSAQKYQIVCGYYPPLNLRLPVHYPNDFYLENKVVMDVLNTIVYGIGLPSVFGLITTIATVITAVKLKGAAAWRQSSVSAVAMETREVAVTRMLVVVSCLFIACTVPNIVVRVTPVVDEEFRLGGRHQNLLLGAINIIYAANAINCTFNFFFYLKMGSRFRRVLRDLVCKPRAEGDTEVSSMCKTVNTAVD